MSTLTSISQLYRLTFNGRNGAGSISVPGVKSGDVMLVVLTPGGLSSGTFFQKVVTDDEVVQENNSNHSAFTYEAIVLRV